MEKKQKSNCFEGGRTKMPEYYLKTENWPPFDEKGLDVDVKKRFNLLKSAISKYLNFSSMEVVRKDLKMSEGRFFKIFHKCGELTPDGEIYGWSALVAGRSIGGRKRIASISASPGSKGGWSGAFGKLLSDKPGIASALTEYLNAPGKKRSTRPNRVEFRATHRRFLKICAIEGITEEEYPFCTNERGRKALRGWIDNVYLPLNANRFVGLEHGPEAESLSRYGEGDGSASRPVAKFREWTFDEVTMDVSARYEIPNAAGDWEELELARFFMIRLIDKGSGANLAMRLVFAPQATADDISELFWDALNGPPEVPKPIEGETLLEGAGYPSVILSKLRFALPAVVHMDRALSHLAGHVQSVVTSLFGGTVILGPARTPRERAEIESRFSLQARRVVHQLPGTTGSGPKDPVRKRAAVPVDKLVRANELLQVLDAYCRNENVTPAAASGNIAPLERLRRLLEAGVLEPVYLDPDKRKPYFFSQPVRVAVKGNIAKGVRPYVNYLYMRYSSAELGRDFAMEGGTLLLRPDLRNLRTVMLFREDGRFYGAAQVLGRWSSFPHDQRMRRIFGRLKRLGELGDRADDYPLEALFEHLRKKAPRDRKAALQLSYILEYLTRNFVALGPELNEAVNEWRDFQQAKNDIGVLPIKAPASVQSALPPVLAAPQKSQVEPAKNLLSEEALKEGRADKKIFKPRPSIAR